MNAIDAVTIVLKRVSKFRYKDTMAKKSLYVIVYDVIGTGWSVIIHLICELELSVGTRCDLKDDEIVLVFRRCMISQIKLVDDILSC